MAASKQPNTRAGRQIADGSVDTRSNPRHDTVEREVSGVSGVGGTGDAVTANLINLTNRY